MKPKIIFLAVIGILAFQSAEANQVTVSKAWVRPTAPGQVVTGAYMEITARDAARLIAVRSPISPSVQIHWMQMDGDVMRMREVQALDLPKKRAVSLQPGGYHLMLTRLKKPIQAGDNIPLTLVIETQGKREIVALKAIAQASPTDETHDAHDHKHH